MTALPQMVLDRYIKILSDYYTWTQIKKNQYGDNASPFLDYDKSDYEKVRGDNATIAAIENVLCLTEEEILHYNDIAKKAVQNAHIVKF